MKAKNVVIVIAICNLAGAVLTSLLALTFRPSWSLATPLCTVGWAVLAFPLGWLGLIASQFSASPLLANLLFGAGLLTNACLWGWMADRIIEAVRQKGTHQGLDTSTISPRIVQLRRAHTWAAHCPSRPLYARKELVTAASRTLRRFQYFSSREIEHQESKENAKVEL